MRIFLLAWIRVMSACCFAGDVYSVSQVEEQFLRHRGAITSGKFVVNTATKTGENGPLVSIKFVVYLDGDRRRVDRFEVPPVESGNKGEFRRVFLETAEFAVDYTELEPVAGHKVVCTIRPPNGQESLKQPDPRLLGIRATSFQNLVYARFAGNMGGMASIHSSTASADVKNGEECCRVDYLTGDGIIKAWYVPSKDYEILSVSEDLGTIHQEISCDLRQVNGYGWFPSEILYKRVHHEDGVSKEFRSQVTKIEVESMNVPMPANTFSIEGIGIPEGYPIHDLRDPPQIKVMTKNGVASETPVSRRDVTPIVQEKSYSLMWLWVGNATAILCIFLYFRYRTR